MAMKRVPFTVYLHEIEHEAIEVQLAMMYGSYHAGNKKSPFIRVAVKRLVTDLMTKPNLRKQIEAEIESEGDDLSGGE